MRLLIGSNAGGRAKIIHPLIHVRRVADEVFTEARDHWLLHSDLESRDVIVQKFIPHAIKIASRYAYHCYAASADLVSAGLLGLLNGLRAYKDNSIQSPLEKYLTVSIHSACCTFIEQMKLINKPGATARASKDYTVPAVVKVTKEIEEAQFARSDAGLRDFELTDYLAVKLSPEDLQLIEYRLAGYTIDEIARTLTLSKSDVFRNLEELRCKLSFHTKILLNQHDV